MCKNGLAEKIFKIGTLEYKLNNKGKEFFNNIYLNPTVKEKEIYSREIDYDKMSTLDNVMIHKKYFEEVMKKIGGNDNFIKVARLHDKLFKTFFEEYDVLIKYAITKYGKNCSIRSCGRETENTIKCDGIIKTGEIEEKIEITSPFHDEEEKIQIKELNKIGISCTRVFDGKDIEKNIIEKVTHKINEKNTMNSYDKTINLVVMFDDFTCLFSEQLANQKYIDSLFDGLKRREYKFKSVSILVDRYIGNNIKLEPRIIKIK